MVSGENETAGDTIILMPGYLVIIGMHCNQLLMVQVTTHWVCNKMQTNTKQVKYTISWLPIIAEPEIKNWVRA